MDKVFAIFLIGFVDIELFASRKFLFFNYFTFYSIYFLLGFLSVFMILPRQSKYMCFNEFLYGKTYVSYIFHKFSDFPSFLFFSHYCYLFYFNGIILCYCSSYFFLVLLFLLLIFLNFHIHISDLSLRSSLLSYKNSKLEKKIDYFILRVQKRGFKCFLRYSLFLSYVNSVLHFALAHFCLSVSALNMMVCPNYLHFFYSNK
jgi:hypothetical protein